MSLASKSINEIIPKEVLSFILSLSIERGSDYRLNLRVCKLWQQLLAGSYFWMGIAEQQATHTILQKKTFTPSWKSSLQSYWILSKLSKKHYQFDRNIDFCSFSNNHPILIFKALHFLIAYDLKNDCLKKIKFQERQRFDASRNFLLSFDAKAGVLKLIPFKKSPAVSIPVEGLNPYEAKIDDDEKKILYISRSQDHLNINVYELSLKKTSKFVLPLLSSIKNKYIYTPRHFFKDPYYITFGFKTNGKRERLFMCLTNTDSNQSKLVRINFLFENFLAFNTKENYFPILSSRDNHAFILMNLFGVFIVFCWEDLSTLEYPNLPPHYKIEFEAEKYKIKTICLNNDIVFVAFDCIGEKTSKIQAYKLKNGESLFNISIPFNVKYLTLSDAKNQLIASSECEVFQIEISPFNEQHETTIKTIKKSIK